MHIEVGAYAYEVIMWEDGMPIFESPLISIDSETHMIVEGDPVIPVIAQVCYQDRGIIHIVMWEDIINYTRILLQRNPEATFVFHNAPFDLHVLGMDGELKQEWLGVIVSGRVIDTGIRFILRNLDIGSGMMQWNLKLAAKTMLDITMVKDKNIREFFTREEPLTDPEVEYAAMDAAVTALLAVAMPKAYPTEIEQLLGFLALSNISRTGMRVDLKRMALKRDELNVRVAKNTVECNGWGYFKGESGNATVLQKILKNLEPRVGLTFPRTEKKHSIKTTDDTIELLGALPHVFLQAWKEIQGDAKVVSNYLREDLIGTDGRVHSTFSPLVKTGRTSSARPNMQNLPRKGGIRGIYVPPRGHLLYACDYSQLELCALSETCLERYGESVMADVINSGADLHQWFGDKIMEARGNTKEDLDADGNEIDWRQQAKACNFGYPGGMGTTRFILQSKANYNVDFTEDQAFMLKELWLSSFPEMEYHLAPNRDFNKYKIVVDGVEKWVSDRYIAQTINGRTRRGATYCAACNYPFQGLAADGAKMALWYLYQAGYPVVNFIHDETITELKRNQVIRIEDDDPLQAKVKDIDRLMLAGMQQVITNVLVKVEGALMNRWEKGAKPIYNRADPATRKLLVWEDTIVKSRSVMGLQTFDNKGKLLVPKY